MVSTSSTYEPSDQPVPSVELVETTGRGPGHPVRISTRCRDFVRRGPLLVSLLAVELPVDAGAVLAEDLGQEGSAQLPRDEAGDDDDQQDEPEHVTTLRRGSASDGQADQQPQPVEQLGDAGQLEHRDQSGTVGPRGYYPGGARARRDVREGEQGPPRRSEGDARQGDGRRAEQQHIESARAVVPEPDGERQLAGHAVGRDVTQV